jgi:CheY-like chemotaxis protein
MDDQELVMIERRHPRLPVHLALGFSGDQFGMGSLLDLSWGGCLVESSAPIHIGDCLTLRIQFSVGSSLLVVNAATVVWTRGHQFGLSFIRMVLSERERLQGYLQTLNIAASKRVLIMMEGADVAKLLTEKLEPLGCMIKTAQDGLVALKEAHRFRPHLIILDIAIPGGGGLSIIQRLKWSTDTHDIPIIVLTASANVGIMERALSLGVARYLQKPDSFDFCIEEAMRLLTLSA